MSETFSRLELLLGAETLERFRETCVLVTGVGAVGSFAVEALARSAIGSLWLVDFDVVCPSNINRQLVALHSTIGRPKVEVAAQRIRDINPACKVVERKEAITEANVGSLLDAAKPQVVVDAMDDTAAKVALYLAALARGIPVVASMGAASRTDPAAVRVGDISETLHCPLARLLRKKLRKQGVSSGVRCVYSVELPTGRMTPVDRAANEDPTIHQYKRQILGSMCSLPGIFGLTIAREVLGLI